MKLTAAGILFMGSILVVLLRICGKSLLRVIDESIEKKKARGEAKDGDDEDQALLTARRKVRWMLAFAARQMTLKGAILLTAIFSKYGTAAPLLLFYTPVVGMTLIKLIIAVQLFSGRSKLNAPQRPRYRTARRLRLSRTCESNLRCSFSRKGQIVPTENFSTFHPTLVKEFQQVHKGPV